MSQDPTTEGAAASREWTEERDVAQGGDQTRAQVRSDQGLPRDRSAGKEHRGGRRSTFLKFTTEVVFISLGVFLALMADQWREDRHTRQLAEASLRGFRTEIRENREKVTTVKDYHSALLGSLRDYLAADAAARPRVVVRIQGIQPVFFEQTAWDLAIGTQSLAQIDQDIASRLSRIYGLQRTYLDQTRGILQAIYLRPLTENYPGLAAYYGDVVLWEPALIRMYDDVLPRIDRVLGE